MSQFHLSVFGACVCSCYTGNTVYEEIISICSCDRFVFIIWSIATQQASEVNHQTMENAHIWRAPQIQYETRHRTKYMLYLDYSTTQGANLWKKTTGFVCGQNYWYTASQFHLCVCRWIFLLYELYCIQGNHGLL